MIGCVKLCQMKKMMENKTMTLRKIPEVISRAYDYLRLEDLRRTLRRLKWTRRYMKEAVQYAKVKVMEEH